MREQNNKRDRMALGSFNTTTLSVIVAVAAAIFLGGAIYAYNNSPGADTSGDDMRPVGNNAQPAANPASTSLANPTTPSAR
jgi:hypothetical protein